MEFEAEDRDFNRNKSVEYDNVETSHENHQDVVIQPNQEQTPRSMPPKSDRSSQPPPPLPSHGGLPHSYIHPHQHHHMQF